MKHLILKYFRIGSLDGIRQCLASGFPIAFGFIVFDNFMNIGPDGMMPLPDLNVNYPEGGHAVLAIGYDDERRLIKVRNSWGIGFGDHGNFYMPYEFIADKRMCSDFWTIMKEM